MVECRSSQNKPSSGLVSILMSCSGEFYSFSLSANLHTKEPTASTRISTAIYMNCPIKSIMCDVNKSINKQFQFQTKRYHVRSIKINVSLLSLVGPSDCIWSPFNVLAVCASSSSVCHLTIMQLELVLIISVMSVQRQ